MANKHDGHHAAAHPSAPPPPVSTPVTPSDKLLSSVIPLPPNSRVAYVTFVPAADGPSYDLIELGRRHLVARNDSLTLLESILPDAHVDGAASALHAFMLTSVEGSDTCLSALRAISLDGLAGECLDRSRTAFRVHPCIHILPVHNSHYSQFQMPHSSNPKVSILAHLNAQPSHLLVTSAVTQNAPQAVIQISRQLTSYHASPCGQFTRAS